MSATKVAIMRVLAPADCGRCDAAAPHRRVGYRAPVHQYWESRQFQMIGRGAAGTKRRCGPRFAAAHQGAAVY